MTKIGSNKPALLQVRVIELSARGLSGRKIARELCINRRTVARILAGPEARSIVLEARERAKRMIERADAALHKSLNRGSSRTAIAVLRGAGVFETRAEAIVRHRFQDAQRAQEALEELERKSRRDAEGKFGRRMTPDASAEEWRREDDRLDRLARTDCERAAHSHPAGPSLADYNPTWYTRLHSQPPGRRRSRR